MKKIIAKFNSKCHNTGQAIRKGESIYFDPTTKKVYKEGHQPEVNFDAQYIDAQEEAYFENFYRNNY
jgi:hypothetical protein